ncbi:MAG: hypothetical protein LAT51_03300 [Flavobacteriaceae bacterium]|nr:hypothetical protein [Flavobacteriaceae bacterium]
MNIIKNSLPNKPYLLSVFALFFSSFILSSCGSTIKLNNEDLDEFSSASGFYFNNYPYLVEQTNYRFPSLLDAFKIYEIPKGWVYLDFTDAEELRISYQNQRGKLISHTYEGKFKNNYYEIYFHRINAGIPPIYWQTHIDRMRIAIHKEGNLMINHKFKNGKYYFFGLFFQSVTNDLMIDKEVSKNRQQLYFKKEEILPDDAIKDFRLFL